MGIAEKIIHGITSRIPASWHQKLSAYYLRHACRTIFREKGVAQTLSEILYCKYTGAAAHRRRMNKLKKIRQKEVITVVFQVWNITKWKCDTVYWAMEKHPRFKPIIWIEPEPPAPPQEKILIRERLVQFFGDSNYRCSYATSYDELKKEHNPDIIFIQEPYNTNQSAIHAALHDELLCFIPYGVSNTVSKTGLDLFLYHTLLAQFVENKYVRDEVASIMKNNGRNLIPAGHPIFDYLREGSNAPNSAWKHEKPGIKKIIWAPHWTIENNSFFSVGTFLSVCHDMVRIANKFSDQIQIAFKPHPVLYRTLCDYPEWGQKKTDEYYRLWETMPNTQIETGTYRELFMQSDAMIHDSGSFIVEYPLVNKPCMYLQRGTGYSEFNSITKAALDCYTIGKDAEDIERFIINQVLEGNDPRKEVREQFIQEYLTAPDGKSAAENIIAHLLTVK